MNSRDKGKRGELEAAKLLKEHGYDARRGQQFSGANGDPDVVGLPGIHIEVKRVEKLNIENAVEQSIRDAKEDEKPIVLHRKNKRKWLVTMPFDEWIELYEAWEEANGRR
jgi:Holliday junction resolvase